MMPFICFVIPTLFPVYMWNETWKNSWFSSLLRYAVTLNVTWMVNSVAHLWGSKPYDK
jgi:stearoyl-CoA desaturase (Delta-9 desaturase)